MSIPSTLTAAYPPSHHSSHYGYPNYSNYSHSSSHGGNNTPLQTSTRLAPSYNSYAGNSGPLPTSRPPSYSSGSRQPVTSSNMTTSQSTARRPDGGRRDRRPDWNEFYRNGPPKEIIVIDDDSPERTDRQPANTSKTAAKAKMPEHAAKKRRTGQATAPDKQQAYTYAHYSHESSGDTISTDRTTSLQNTTAPTSLGSYTSSGSNGAYLDDGQVGQKRKRVTRQQAADEKRQKEGQAYSYFPPPKPPIKAKDVQVPHIRDVRILQSETWIPRR